MAINILDGDTITFSEAAKALPRFDGKRIHASTIWRWARYGTHGVRLETRRVGHRFVTTPEALEQFTRALAEIGPARMSMTPRTPDKSRSPSRRDADVAAAGKVLEQAGI